MSRLIRAGQTTKSVFSHGAPRIVPPVPRLVAMVLGSLLLGAYLQAFYRIVDIVGGLPWFWLSVGVALLSATVLASMGSLRAGLGLGGFLVAAGIVVYLFSAQPSLEELFSVAFIENWFSFLTGLTVLQFDRVGVWAIVVAPGPAFLSWFLLLTRRYAASAVVGGLMLAFFASTGDASPTVTLVGMTSLLGLLGAGQIEQYGDVLREVVQLGLVMSLAVVIGRTVRVVPRTAGEPVPVGGSGSGGAGEHSLTGDLGNADEEAHIGESISLSPVAYFSIDTDRPTAWRVAAYDRYTGNDWVRTGALAPYDGSLEPPPGDSSHVDQDISVHQSVQTLPAAWKPLAINGLSDTDVQVTELNDLIPTREFTAGEQFTVRSAIPDVDEGLLREAGDSYPLGVTDRYLQLPDSTSDQVRQLAAQLTEEAPTDYDAAETIRQWLVREKSYDTTVERPSGDVAEWFLFSMDGGYCVYFATAMIVLLRAIDVPARLVLGYTPGQPVSDNRWVVRGFDSHAWVEVYFPGQGWVGFDPTPATSRRITRIDLLDEARRENLAGVDVAGSSSVRNELLYTAVTPVRGNLTAAVNMTSLTDPNQSAADDPLRRNASSSDSFNGSTNGPRTSRNASTGSLEGQNGVLDTDSVSRAAESLDSWIASRDRLALLAGGAGTLLGLYWVGGFERGYTAARIRWQRPTDSPRRDVERAYRRFELLLARRHRDRSRGETRRGHLAAAGYRDLHQTRRLVDLYERAAYGDGVTRAEADEAIRIVDELIHTTV